MGVEEQLFKLYTQCCYIQSENILSEWIYYAVSRYIRTGRSGIDFERRFCELSENKMKKMIKYCLLRGLSDAEIIDSVKSFIGQRRR